MEVGAWPALSCPFHCTRCCLGQLQGYGGWSWGVRLGDTMIGKVDLMGPAGEADLLPWTVCRFLSGRWLESWHRQCPPGLAALNPSAGALGLLQGNPHWCWAPTLHPTVGGRGQHFHQVPCPSPGKSLIASCLWAFPAVRVTGAGPQIGTR